ncbi:MAG: hypothetical protein IT322_07460 [Anaerolineae bacterium]|nr:hypothetical protein [Anaerolineae bacterium]
MTEHQQTQSQAKQLLSLLQRWDMRLRLTLLPLWIPRGIMVGLGVGLAAAIFSRMRPSLMPSQVMGIALLGVVVGGVGAFLVVWLLPRSPIKAARYFDRVFGLKERTSTALEVAAGIIPAAAGFDTLQAQDALAHAAQVKASRHLPFRARRGELGFMVLLAALVAVLAFSFNPQLEALAQERAVSSAIEAQADKLREIKRDIEANKGLSDDEKRELTKLIDDALEKLEQPEITQPEAVAELSKTAELLNEKREGLNQRQREAAKQGGEALNQNPTTQGIGQPLEAGDLGKAASEMNNLAERLKDNQLTEDQAREAADALEEAAKALEELNPEAADALKRAAEALRQGNQEEAAKALEEAAKALQNQQGQMDNSDLSKAAENAANEINQSSSEIAQAGKESSSKAPSGQKGESRTAANPGQPGQQGQPGQDSSSESQAGQPSSSPDGQGEGDPGELMDNADSSSGGDAQDGAQEGDGTGAQSDSDGTEGNPGEGQSGNIESSRGNAAGAGVGSGGSGSDVTEGKSNEQPINPNNQRGDGRLADNRFIYAPSFIGGEGGDKIGVESDQDPGETDPTETGDFTSNPEGESKVRVRNVVGAAKKQADQAMENDRVPGALRGVIREYFSGLQQ